MTLLHNMSCPSRAVIVQVAAPAQRRCRGLVFRLPSGIGLRRPAGLLSLLGDSVAGQNAEKELRRKLNDHARTMALPAVALASDQARPEDIVAESLLDICTVLAKSSGRVYLKDKEPNLTRIRPGVTVVLQLPPNWSVNRQ